MKSSFLNTSGADVETRSRFRDILLSRPTEYVLQGILMATVIYSVYFALSTARYVQVITQGYEAVLRQV